VSAAGPLAPAAPASAAGAGRVRRPSRLRRAVVVGTALIAVAAASGCASGIKAETSRERPTIDGIGGAIGTITIRNAYVGGPAEAGGSVPVLLALFNNGNNPDRLVNVTSPEATASSVPADITLASGGQQLLYTPERAPRLTGLTQEARVAEIVPLVLTFERAGELHLEVPVQGVPEELLREPAAPAPAAPPPAPAGSAAPGASAAPQASATPAGGASPSATPSITP
jgi:hypothetical protein